MNIIARMFDAELTFSKDLLKCYRPFTQDQPIEAVLDEYGIHIAADQRCRKEAARVGRIG